MKNRTLLFYMTGVLWALVMFGFLLPYFMSMKSDTGVAIALAVIVVHVVVIAVVINKKLFSKNGEKNEDQ